MTEVSIESPITKEEYIQKIKDELEDLLEQDNVTSFEFDMNEGKFRDFIGIVCQNIKNFSEDIWRLAEVVGGILFDHYGFNALPGHTLVSYLVIKLFRKSIETVCDEANSI